MINKHMINKNMKYKKYYKQMLKCRSFEESFLAWYSSKDVGVSKKKKRRKMGVNFVFLVFQFSLDDSAAKRLFVLLLLLLFFLLLLLLMIGKIFAFWPHKNTFIIFTVSMSPIFYHLFDLHYTTGMTILFWSRAKLKYHISLRAAPFKITDHIFTISAMQKCFSVDFFANLSF
jgi:hypothetical protein